jgi:hypothetical protein
MLLARVYNLGHVIIFGAFRLSCASALPSCALGFRALKFGKREDVEIVSC